MAASGIWASWCDRWSLHARVRTLALVGAFTCLNEWVLQCDLLCTDMRQHHLNWGGKLALNLIVGFVAVFLLWGARGFARLARWTARSP